MLLKRLRFTVGILSADWIIVARWLFDNAFAGLFADNSKQSCFCIV